MIQSLELIADEHGGLHLPPDLILRPGAKALLVLERPPHRPTRPGWGKVWVRRVADDFDAPLDEGFWTGTSSL